MILCLLLGESGVHKGWMLTDSSLWCPCWTSHTVSFVLRSERPAIIYSFSMTYCSVN